MSKKSIKLNSKDIIIARDTISREKTRYWRIIKSENIMSKAAKKAGAGSGFDLNALYNSILQKSNNLIKIKLMLNAINSGIKTFNFEEAKKTHYYNIYLACELKEQLAHWEEILKKSTINPATKAKAGSKGTGKIETFTSAKIASIKKKLQLEINKIDAEIAKFNDEAILDLGEDETTSLESMMAA